MPCLRRLVPFVSLAQSLQFIPTPGVQNVLRVGRMQLATPMLTQVVFMPDSCMISRKGAHGNRAGHHRLGHRWRLENRCDAPTASAAAQGTDHLPFQVHCPSLSLPNSTASVEPPILASAPWIQSGCHPERGRSPRLPLPPAGSNPVGSASGKGDHSVHTVHRSPWRTRPTIHVGFTPPYRASRKGGSRN